MGFATLRRLLHGTPPTNKTPEEQLEEILAPFKNRGEGNLEQFLTK